MSRTARIVTAAEALVASGSHLTDAFVTAVHSVPGHTAADRALAMRIFANLFAA